MTLFAKLVELGIASTTAGLDGNSPDTKALSEVIHKPGLDIFQTFNQVGLQVKKATGGAQQPWVSSSPIKGVFCFKPET